MHTDGERDISLIDCPLGHNSVAFAIYSGSTTVNYRLKHIAYLVAQVSIQFAREKLKSPRELVAQATNLLIYFHGNGFSAYIFSVCVSVIQIYFFCVNDTVAPGEKFRSAY